MKITKLHDIVKHIYTAVFKLSFIEVQTDTGWTTVKSLNITEPTEQIQLIADNGKTLICAPNHILIDHNYNEILAKDSLHTRIKTLHGNVLITGITPLDKKEQLFDLTLSDKSNHLYYANGFLSHNCVICDEFSFVPNNIASKVFESIYPVISSSKNSQFIIVSTPNGADTKNLYYEIWQKANSKSAGANAEGWKAFRFDWWDVPGRDEQWKLNTIASIGQQRFDQEFGNQFLTSSSIKKLIPDDMIEQYRIKLSEYKVQGIVPKKQKIVSEAEDEIFEFEMWHEFQPSKTYLASMDIAEGTGGDSSVLYVWDVSDLSNITMCAKFASPTVSLVQFAYIASKILALYNNPFLAAERNGVSAGTLDSLKITYGYSNIAVENKKDEAGIFSHVQNKSKACLWLRDMMTTKGFGFTLYDKQLIEEMTIFCKKDTKGGHLVYQALPGPDSHDDHMMAFVWLAYLLHNERIDKYFVVVKTFRSELDVMYPQLLKPLHEYLSEDYAKIKSDKLYKDFIEFKEEAYAKLGKAYQSEIADQRNDLFNYAVDPYFDGDDGPMWNMPYTPPQQGISMNPNARMPIYVIT